MNVIMDKLKAIDPNDKYVKQIEDLEQQEKKAKSKSSGAAKKK